MANDQRPRNSNRVAERHRRYRETARVLWEEQLLDAVLTKNGLAEVA
jgi:hypothetical protein